MGKRKRHTPNVVKVDLEDIVSKKKVKCFWFSFRTCQRTIVKLNKLSTKSQHHNQHGPTHPLLCSTHSLSHLTHVQ